MTAPGYTGYQVARDPTAVIGARIGAYFIDALLALALLLVLAPTPVNPWAEYVEVPDGMEYGDACDELGRSDDVDMCYELGDRAYFTDGPVVVAQSVVPLVYSVLVLVVLQGLTGFTLGKVLFGIRTVREDGQVPGILRAFLRTILWVVDGQPCGIPLVGLITGISTKGHRRVGDMVAKTFVVNKADAGRPVVVAGVTDGYGTGAPGGYPAPGGYGAPGYGAPGYGAPGYGSPTAYPGPGGYPSAPPGGAWGATPPTAPPADSSTTPWGASPPTETAPSASAAEQAAGIAAPQPPPDSGDPYRRGFGAGASLGGAEGGPSGETPATAATDTSATAPGPTRESTEPTGGLSPEPAESAVPTGSAVPTDSAVPTESSVPSLSSEPAAEGTAGPGGDQGQEAPDESDTASESPAAAPAEPTAPTEQQPEAQQEAPTYNPQWDAARGTYIQWDPNRGRWLAWDDNAKQWHVI